LQGPWPEHRREPSTIAEVISRRYSKTDIFCDTFLSLVAWTDRNADGHKTSHNANLEARIASFNIARQIRNFDTSRISCILPFPIFLQTAGPLLEVRLRRAKRAAGQVGHTHVVDVMHMSVCSKGTFFLALPAPGRAQKRAGVLVAW